MCDNEYEDLVHFILHCPAYIEERRKNRARQQLYPEKDDQVLWSLLFINQIENFEVTKRILFNIWKLEPWKWKKLACKTQPQTQAKTARKYISECRVKDILPPVNSTQLNSRAHMINWIVTTLNSKQHQEPRKDGKKEGEKKVLGADIQVCT